MNKNVAILMGVECATVTYRDMKRTADDLLQDIRAEKRPERRRERILTVIEQLANTPAAKDIIVQLLSWLELDDVYLFKESRSSPIMQQFFARPDTFGRIYEARHLGGSRYTHPLVTALWRDIVEWVNMAVTDTPVDYWQAWLVAHALAFHWDLEDDDDEDAPLPNPLDLNLGDGMEVRLELTDIDETDYPLRVPRHTVGNDPALKFYCTYACRVHWTRRYHRGRNHKNDFRKIWNLCFPGTTDPETSDGYDGRLWDQVQEGFGDDTVFEFAVCPFDYAMRFGQREAKRSDFALVSVPHRLLEATGLTKAWQAIVHEYNHDDTGMRTANTRMQQQGLTKPFVLNAMARFAYCALRINDKATIFNQPGNGQHRGFPVSGPKLVRGCAACGAPDAEAQCGHACGNAVYCNQECAQAHYDEHRRTGDCIH
jgi:hypothetical protein